MTIMATMMGLMTLARLSQFALDALHIERDQPRQYVPGAQAKILKALDFVFDMLLCNDRDRSPLATLPLHDCNVDNSAHNHDDCTSDPNGSHRR